MHLVDLTLATPPENLALDEALLDASEQSAAPREVLRVWESPVPIVVVGRSSQVELEVDLEYCRAQGIAVLRRASGGAAIVAGPGSLMYAVVLSYDLRPELRSLDEAHRFVLDTTLSALAQIAPGARRRGTSDLALGELKFSGNSVRCKRRHLLYHGTLLYDFDLPLVAHCLNMPPRQPDYRQGRSHGAFITNLSTTSDALRQALVATWDATTAPFDLPSAEVDRLVTERYGRDEWTMQR
jgi:lipoate---protein ligase